MTAKERFLRYVKYDTTSDEGSETCPSTAKQLVLLKDLHSELLSMGIDSKIDENGYVYAKIPSNVGERSKVCFIAHVDTSPAVSGKDVNPTLVDYKGGDVLLANGLKITEIDTPDLKKYVGKELIVTDGNTLLGADDKAGVAEIMTAVEVLVKNPQIKHGDVFIAFTPDEEIGRGTDKFNLKDFGADFGYTIDGGALGEIEYENFNAASLALTVNGVSIHPGSAKNVMKNAVDLFCEFHAMLPETMRPNSTEGYEGFYMADDISGGIENLSCKYIIRNHDKEKFEAMKEYVVNAVEFLNKKHGANTFITEIKDSYFNMSEIIKDNFHLIDNAKQAMKSVGVEPIIIPIRGGTDGARLSYEGLPCPNLSTGGYNFHGRREFIPSFALEKMVEVILKLVDIYSKQ
ncbi:MAG: peptidase T [Clostridia bacterium]|nr:peptidase T [Clostridia bacterium]